MQLIQFLAAWLFPGAQCFAMEEIATADDSSDLDRASSSSSPSAAGSSGSSSLSSPSSSSTDDARHSGFFKPRSRSRQESPSTTPLCFGAGGDGAGRRLLRGSRPRTPATEEAEAASPTTMALNKVKGDVVGLGRYLRKISRRLNKARRDDGKGSPSPSPSPMAAAAVDDTARERAESVARAISYCKDTLRRGTSRSSRSPSPSPPPPSPPSPSLDEWLSDRQEEIIESAAEQHCCDDCGDSRSLPTRRPRRGAPGWPLGMQTMTAKRFKESPCSATPIRRDGSVVAVARGEADESSSPHHGHGSRGESSMSSLDDEMEFLKAFDGDEEMINHHFITVEI